VQVVDEISAGASDQFALRAQTQTPEFRNWFQDSKVVDEGGEPLVVYHGAARGDRIDEKGVFDPKRATSGPMAFFTDSADVASNYSKNKIDTSLMDEGDVAQYFTVSPKALGHTRGRTPYTVEQSWHHLTPVPSRATRTSS
jgi:hypothetical protein